ncbi:hypothetical protein QYM13_21925 [Bacillus pacificus]|uniref:hypothetical protein n=1 Tax=Bacillus pacificus TaxID=2026187 RepID=UPI0027EE8339|nr:hypothetical protein [Bacillus pacificus]MDQ7236422.1 hypothetical protein [Bacillus pacificus]MDQ7239568.1 hypothetical protein [Bacillus pacificus]
MDKIEITEEHINETLIEFEEDNHDYITIKTKCEEFFVWKKDSLLVYYGYYIKECSGALEHLTDKDKIIECQKMLDGLLLKQQKHEESLFNFIISNSVACDTDYMSGANTKEEVLTILKTVIGINNIIELDLGHDMSYMENFAESYFS